MKPGRSRARTNDAREFLPLKPTWFHILLTLAGGETHGYAIRQEVEERTGGAVVLWPTTLYGALSRLEDAGLIEETADRSGRDDDVQRRFYRLTTGGRAVLAAETDRLASLVRESRARQQSKSVRTREA